MDRSYIKQCFFSVLLIFVISSTFLSCNFIFGSLRGKENPNDDSTQIAHFTAVPSASGGTVTTAWEWREAPSSYDSSEIIKTVKVVHSSLGWPELNIFGEEFNYSETRTFDWSGLKDGNHYFALFYKSGGFFDQWYAPLYAKVTLPGTTAAGVIYDRINSVNIDSGMEEWLYDITPINPLYIYAWKWAVVYFDFPDDVNITFAEINLSIGSSVATEITFAPLNGTLGHGDVWDKWNKLSDNSIVDISNSITFTGPLISIYNITGVVKAASLTYQKAILIRTNDTGPNITLDNDASPPWIFADIIK